MVLPLPFRSYFDEFASSVLDMQEEFILVVQYPKPLMKIDENRWTMLYRA